MCGIMGYYSFGEKLPDKEKIASLFSLLETRGHNASGFAYILDGNLIVQKAPIKSSDMVKTDIWKELTIPKIMIFHTRLKTQGDETNNYNNHPLFNKQGLALVHNGIISNDQQILARNRRDGEVDSEAILVLLSSRSKGDKIKRVFDRLEGSFSFAVIDKNSPNTLMLVKKDNPLDLYLNTEEDILYFCSERELMKEAFSITTASFRGFNIGENNYHFYGMENNHCLILNSEGVESYKRYYPKRAVYQYGRDHYNEDLVVDCPFCLTRTMYDPNFLINQCRYCGSEINEEDMYVFA